MSPAVEVLDREVNTSECISSIAMDCLKPPINRFGQISFLSEEPDRRSLLEFAHLTLKVIVNGSQMERVDNQKGTERKNQYHP
jgi:hypothetical protein